MIDIIFNGVPMRILTQEEHNHTLISNMAYILHMSHIRGIAYKRELVMKLFIGTNYQEKYIELYLQELRRDIKGRL